MEVTADRVGMVSVRASVETVAAGEQAETHSQEAGGMGEMAAMAFHPDRARSMAALPPPTATVCAELAVREVYQWGRTA